MTKKYNPRKLGPLCLIKQGPEVGVIAGDSHQCTLKKQPIHHPRNSYYYSLSKTMHAWLYPVPSIIQKCLIIVQLYFRFIFRITLKIRFTLCFPPLSHDGFVCSSSSINRKNIYITKNGQKTNKCRKVKISVSTNRSNKYENEIKQQGWHFWAHACWVWVLVGASTSLFLLLRTQQDSLMFLAQLLIHYVCDYQAHQLQVLHGPMKAHWPCTPTDRPRRFVVVDRKKSYLPS